MNQIFNNIIIQNFLNFKNSFENTKKIFWDKEKERLLHPGEFGIFRESLAKIWLKSFIPQKFELASGFVITSKNRVSTQCDIIIYDKYETPLIENPDKQKFFPIETVAGIIEIKSDINSIGELNSHLIKLSELKKFRQDVQDPAPYNRDITSLEYNLDRIPFDNVFTILICNKLNFKLDVNQINYQSISIRYHHNLVLSLSDGIINYSTNKGSHNLFFSFIGDEIHKYNFLKNDSNSESPLYINNFLNSIHYLLKRTCLHKIDTSFYFDDTPTRKIS